MTGDPHIGFIVAAYLVGGLIIAAMIILTIVDYAALKKTLARLTARTGAHADHEA